MTLRLSTSFLGACLAGLLNAQTYFYIDQIAVQPPTPTDQDLITIALIGNLSASNSTVTFANASVVGGQVIISIGAQSEGIGLPVLVPHTEFVSIGQLPAGDYQIVIDGQFVGDFAPIPQHFFTVTGGGGPDCGSLDLFHLQWHPFADTALVVGVANPLGEAFDYPNFILLDEQGDTLAVEIVNFFGIAAESWHLLRIPQGTTVPTGPFNGTLQLWTGFTTVLACSWEGPFDLCPPAPCTTLYPTLQNTSGTSFPGTFNYEWTIFDDDGPVANGDFVLNNAQPMDMDTVCLPPGNYHIVTNPLQPPFPGLEPVYSVTGEGYIAGPSMAVSWSLPVLLPFDFLAPCIDIGTDSGPIMASLPPFTVGHREGHLHIERADGSMLGEVLIHDALGRLLHAYRTNSDRLTVPMGRTPAGILFVRCAAGSVRYPWLPGH